MTPQPQQKEDVCAEEDFCKGCDNFDGFYNSCKLAQYKTSIQGKTVWIAPRTNGTRWLLKSVGCASDTRTSRPATPPLAMENLTVGAVMAYEAGLKDGAAQARDDILAALARDWKGRYVEDAVAEIRRFPESLRTGGNQV